MNILHALVLGVLEGVTEFLPISSTGHLIITSALLKIPTTDFLKTFEIIIQLGAILAVVVLYFKKLFNIALIKRLIVAFLPTAVIGLLLYKFIKIYLLGNTTIVVSTLFLCGILLIVFEWWYKKNHTLQMVGDVNIEEIGYKKAFTIGLFQSIAIIPGVSRSGATILGGLFLGIPRKTIVEFSFLLAIPTMLAATGLDVLKNYKEITSADFNLLLVGLVTSFIVALGVIKWFLSYIQKHSFVGFGIYRIIIAVLFWLILL